MHADAEVIAVREQAGQVQPGARHHVRGVQRREREADEAALREVAAPGLQDGHVGIVRPRVVTVHARIHDLRPGFGRGDHRVEKLYVKFKWSLYL